jgi:hypothetical protein
MEQYMSGATSSSLSSVPNGRIIDFERAELRRVPFQDSLYLWVSGSLPGPGFEAKLAPRLYYGRPDYWDIEVAVVTANAANDADEELSLNFERSVPLTGITGNRGITVIGASQVKRIEISDESF